MTLEGTPRQVELAGDVRARALRSVERHATLLRRCRRGPHAALVEELGRELARETSARWWLGQRGERPTGLAAALGWPALVVEAMGTAYAGDLPFARSRAVTAWLAGGGTGEPAEIGEAAIQLALDAAAAAAERRDKGWTR